MSSSSSPPPAIIMYQIVIIALTFILPSAVHAQYKPQWPDPIVSREIFVLNLEDGYYGCQVNDSSDYLQLFELSKLCDGTPQCFRGSDEMSVQLKCTDRGKQSVTVFFILFSFTFSCCFLYQHLFLLLAAFKLLSHDSVLNFTRASCLEGDTGKK